jgi:hypothetical protein
MKLYAVQRESCGKFMFPVIEAETASPRVDGAQFDFTIVTVMLLVKLELPRVPPS